MNIDENDPSFPKDVKNATQAIDALLVYVNARGASDLHCDPRPDGIYVRIRVDGLLQHVGILPRTLLEEFISRLKILSGARTDIHAIPQDGRWQTSVGGMLQNIRISFVPTYYGENAVMRILAVHASGHSSLSRLGFVSEQINTIEESLRKTSGLILVTGPTGSGKTTTLHSCLSIKAKEPLSIITLEDPVEYEISGVRQVHIRHTHGVTFASGLRSALRQDPDVIMVGEIRDSETANVAIHTALTGHLVLSTLHTNSALETIPRLIDMGIDHYLLAATLKLIVAQRLVREICGECNGEGCDECRQTGYHGRTIIAEICEIDPYLRSLISSKKSDSDIGLYVQSRGFRSLYEDGMEKVEWGITSNEEILRVLHT